MFYLIKAFTSRNYINLQKNLIHLKIKELSIKERYETIDFIPSKIKKEKLNKIVIPQTLQIKVNKEIPFRERYEKIDF